MKERPLIFGAPMVKALLAGRKSQTRRVVKDIVEGPGGWPSFTRGRHDGNMVKPKYCPYGRVGDRLWVRETWMEFDRTPSIETTIGGGSRVVGHLPGGIGYKADLDYCGQVPITEGGLTVLRTPGERWRSPMFMPRSASRITLEITEVRVERLQSISEADAEAEGLECVQGDSGPGPCYPWRGKGYWDGKSLHSQHGGKTWHAPGANGFCCCYAGQEARLSPAVCAYRHLWDSINGAKYPWASSPWVWVAIFRRLEAPR